jgi:hypothetical protein
MEYICEGALLPSSRESVDHHDGSPRTRGHPIEPLLIGVEVRPPIQKAPDHRILTKKKNFSREKIFLCRNPLPRPVGR